MLLAATAPALLMLVLALGLAALSMLETTSQPRTPLRSSAPVTISHPTPVRLDRSTLHEGSARRVGGSDGVRQTATTGASFRTHTGRPAEAHAPGRTDQRVPPGPRPLVSHPPASRGHTSLTAYRMGASPNR